MVKYSPDIYSAQSRCDMSKKNGTIWDLVVIGAGASGLIAAVTAAKKGARVLVVEHKDQIGKKILATGNGKCNYTNSDMMYNHYHGDDTFVKSVFSQFSHEDTIAFFHQMGIYPNNKNGYFYPKSGQATSIVMSFLMMLERLHVEVALNESVVDIMPSSFGFIIQTKGRSLKGKKVLFATGLLATPKLGSDGSAFFCIKKLGHHFKPIVPALCGFYCEGCDFTKISGVRTEAKVTLYIDGEAVASDCGELQFTDYGVSGIPVFQVSRHASMGLYEKKQVQISLHFLPEMSKEVITKELNYRLHNMEPNQSLLQALNGLFHHKLIPAIIKKSNIPIKTCVGEITEVQHKMLIACIMDFTIDVKKARDYEFAQVCAGGLSSDEVDVITLESKLVPGLYFAGELLNVDGICGGYNLQWAWSSGVVAATHAIAK